MLTRDKRLESIKYIVDNSSYVRVKERLRENNVELNSVQIDNALWLLSKNKEYKDKPHHLSKTIYY